MLTLELAVMLPAAALIYVNFNHLKSFKRDKNVEATIHRDFQYMLSVAEKKINDKFYTMTEEVRDVFPSSDAGAEMDKGRALELILSNNPSLAHAFLYDAEKGFIFRSQPQQMTDRYFRDEHDRLSEMFRGWFGLEAKMMCEGMHKKKRPITWYPDQAKREDGYGYMTTAYFTFPQLSRDRVVLGGVSFDPDYLKETFFPEMFAELVAQKMSEDSENPLAMVVYPADYEGGPGGRLLASSSGWGEGKPEVTRNLDDVFRGLALGIKFEGTTVEAIGRRFVQQSFLILAVLSILMIGGLALTYRSVSKEMALARLKSDFVSNVSHELRTPLSLIQLYAETLELGRILSYRGRPQGVRYARD
jgi:hypothetical protein